MEQKECTHPNASIDDKALFDKQIKVLHSISVKMTIYIKATGQDINHNNAGFYLQMIMRELNKSSFNGPTKRDLALSIMILLLDSLGLPHIVSYYSAEVILEMIEVIYAHRMHRFKRTKKCTIM